MKNPIEGNIYRRGDIEFTIAEDFSEVEIKKDGVSMKLPPSALRDLLIVMEAEARETEGEISLARWWNLVPSSWSLPIAEW